MPLPGTSLRRARRGKPTPRRSSRSRARPKWCAARRLVLDLASWSATTSPGSSSTRRRRPPSWRPSSPSAEEASRLCFVVTTVSCRRRSAPSAPRPRARNCRSSSAWCGTPALLRTCWRSSTACIQRSPPSHASTSTPAAWRTASMDRFGLRRTTSHGQTPRTQFASCRCMGRQPRRRAIPSPTRWRPSGWCVQWLTWSPVA
mmetsp:Transcript_85458/g.245438  ORF Transcript_85458/g.245438 Transcript_85458/m.245438 type:complete len:202 (-) Transcript_85458:164-769(-)